MIGSKTYRVVHIEDRDRMKSVHLICLNDETQHLVTVFPDYEAYEDVEEGREVSGWIRRKGSYYNLVSYCKPERNWAEDEEFM